jgi:plasmid stabilization system protein ParE
MMNSEAQDYYRHRERIERAAAKAAATEAARRIHQQLAQGYAALLRNPRDVTTRPRVSR